MKRLDRNDTNRIIDVIVHNLKLIPCITNLADISNLSNLPTLCIDLKNNISDQNSKGMIYNITHPPTRLLKDQSKKLSNKNLNIKRKPIYELMKEYNNNKKSN